MNLFAGSLVNGDSSSNDELINVLSAYQCAVDNSMISSITDIKGNILYVNKRFCSISKYRSEELTGKSHNIINSGYHSSQFFKQMWKTIGQGHVWHGEIKNKAKDDTFYWVDSIIVPIKNNEGTPFQYLSLRTLISERKANEEKERAQNIKHMEEVLFKISHQMRQPLVQILGLTDLLSYEEDAPEDLKMILSTMKNSAQSLDKYIRELSVFVSKIKQ